MNIKQLYHTGLLLLAITAFSLPIHANVRYEARKTFRYNLKTKKWRLIKWIMVG